ncbi:hypothetical protein EYF80_057194 [Liparis tanakae]|uniref:Uncharacterized protein n=1 Tax=Liparis tanakae TaxID=230148 RepID=A0A4Z2EUW4_9TELE|nr:hypothetical protein EYF80_057194 [Liparis tanakae]
MARRGHSWSLCLGALAAGVTLVFNAVVKCENASTLDPPTRLHAASESHAGDERPVPPPSSAH